MWSVFSLNSRDSYSECVYRCTELILNYKFNHDAGKQLYNADFKIDRMDLNLVKSVIQNHIKSR